MVMFVFYFKKTFTIRFKSKVILTGTNLKSLGISRLRTLLSTFSRTKFAKRLKWVTLATKVKKKKE